MLHSFYDRDMCAAPWKSINGSSLPDLHCKPDLNYSQRHLNIVWKLGNQFPSHKEINFGSHSNSCTPLKCLDSWGTPILPQKLNGLDTLCVQLHIQYSWILCVLTCNPDWYLKSKFLGPRKPQSTTSDCLKLTKYSNFTKHSHWREEEKEPSTFCPIA